MLRINLLPLKLLFTFGQIVVLSILPSCSKNENAQGESNERIYPVTSAQTGLQSSAITVMDNNYELVYLGAMLEGQEIIDSATFNPITGYTKLPIRISSSLAGSTSRSISVPRLSTFRQATQDILRSIPTLGTDITSFLYYYRPFHDYSELRQEFGYNVKTRSLFSTTNTSVINQLTTIQKKNGLVVGFELINFTLDMSLPRANELADQATVQRLVASGNRPVYISSISFGQKGILAIETDYSIEETSKAFEKVTKKIFKKTSETLTMTETNIINNSTVRVYLVGGSNSGSVTQINGYDSFVSYIQDIGVFSADNPGFPISFRCRSLSDFSIFKINY